MSALDECVFITLTKRFTVSGYGYGLVQEISSGGGTLFKLGGLNHD